MFPATEQLLKRLATRYPDAREWFDAVRQWYKDASLSARVIQQLLRGEDVELLSVRLNGDTAADVTRRVDGQRVLISLPPARTRPGWNSLTLALSGDAERPLEVEAVHFGQPDARWRQTIDLAALRPAPAPAFRLTGSERAEPRAGCWEVRANGHLAFRFDLPATGDAVVALDLPSGARFPQARARLTKQKKLLKEVGKRVEEKLKKWVDEANRPTDAADARDDLRAYAELYARQIRPAVEADGPLQSAIDRTGNPDAVVAAAARPVSLQPVVVALAAAPRVAMPLANPTPVYRAARVTPAARARPPKAKLVNAPAPASPPTRRAAAAAKSSGFLGKLVVTLLVAGLSAGAYAAWKNDGLGWVKAQWAAVTKTTSAGPRGDVLTALRESGTDLGWKPEVCQELPADKMKAFAGNFGAVVGPQDATVTGKAKTYMAGVHKNPLGEAIAGFPVCDDMLVVHDFGDAAAAKRFYDDIPTNFQAGLQRSGAQGDTAAVAIPHCEAAVRMTARVGEVRQQTVTARCGRFVLQAPCGDMSTSGEQERRLTVLAKRLNEHFPG